jgi:hypothetical protein
MKQENTQLKAKAHARGVLYDAAVQVRGVYEMLSEEQRPRLVSAVHGLLMLASELDSEIHDVCEAGDEVHLSPR